MLLRFFSLLTPSDHRNGTRRVVKIVIRDCAVILLARALRASQLARPEIVFLILPDKSAMAKQVLTFPRGRQRDRDDRPWFVVDAVSAAQK